MRGKIAISAEVRKPREPQESEQASPGQRSQRETRRGSIREWPDARSIKCDMLQKGKANLPEGLVGPGSVFPVQIEGKKRTTHFEY